MPNVFVCEACAYPSRLPDRCDNPGCEANPSVSAAQKAAWQEARDRIAAADVERARIAGIRRRMMERN